MRFKKGSKEAKAFMAKIRAKKGKKTATKKPIKKINGSFAMFSKKGNEEVNKIIKYAKAKKLSWQAVLNMLNSLSNKYPEAYDTHVREIAYESFMKNKPAKKTVKKIGATKKATKKATPKNLHKDVKSHNVNIRVMSGLFDTSVIKDIDALKKQYFNLAKKYHPDAGGTTSQFQELQKEYEKLFKALLNGSTLNSEQKTNEVEIDKAIRDIIDSIITLEGISIEVVGKWFWVGGNTYPVYQILKSSGLQFIKKGGVPYWVYKGVESSGRGKMTMEEIKTKYGVTKFEKPIKKIGSVHKLNRSKIKKALLKLKKGLDKRPI